MSVINTNVKALNAQASMSNVNKSMETAMERLSTGIRINSAKDDAAGLAIALRMTADIRGTAVAIRNANDGISLSQTAEGGLGQINDILQRMRELAVQSSNGTASADNRAASQLEVSQLKQEIDTIANRTNFNGIKLLDGAAANLKIQTGVNAGDSMTMSISAARAQDIGIGGRASLSATGHFSASQGALAKQLNAGDIIINNVQVGASSAADDGVSPSVNEVVNLTFTAGITKDQTVIIDGVTITGTAASEVDAAGAATEFVRLYNANGVNSRSYQAVVVDATNSPGQVRMTKLVAGDATNVAITGTNGTEVYDVTFAAMANTNTVTIAGVTVTATGAVTANALAAKFAGVALGAKPADGGDMTFTGSLTNAGNTFTPAAAANGAVLRFTSSQLNTVGSSVADLTATAGGGTAPTIAVRAGIINQGASFTIDEGGGDKASSAIAKTAAINAVAAQSGVTATVGRTTVAGSAQTVIARTGTVTINGVESGEFSTTLDAGVSRANTIAAINLLSSQTGVRAVDTGDINKGVQLIAEDGRNVTINYKALTAAGTGLGAKGVTTGSYQLTSVTGGPIQLTSSSSGTIANAGLVAGKFESNVSTVTTVARAVGASGAVPSGSTTGQLLAGSLRVNGIAIDAAVTASDTASDVSATSSTKAASGIAIAAAINAKTALTGVTAKAEATSVQGTVFTANAADKTLRINGVGVFITAAQSATRGGIVTEINRVSGQTGVVATDNGRGLTLEAVDGRNISLALTTNTGTNTDASRAASIGISSTNLFSHDTTAPAASAVTTYSSITLKSDTSFVLEGGSDGNESFTSLGFKTGVVGGSNNGIKVSNIDVSTQNGASLAITALDAAMRTVSMSQAQLGAYQNRLDSAIANLTEGSTNMNASRSRVLDTDYAKESTNLAKAQIISQAATAMLAQANQSAQSVLALLK
jgi:flagellin